MLAVSFKGDKKFEYGIKELSRQLHYELSDTGYEIRAEKTDGKAVAVKTRPEGAVIYYPADNAFFRGFSLAVMNAGKVSDMKAELALTDMGTMQDCSDGLMTVDGLKEMVRQSALIGYTYMGLYTEATFTIEGEPYFGYKSGRYSQAELSEIAEYGEKMQVEIVPFIQTLGHCAQVFRWSGYSDMYDINNTLLVQYDRTYEFIEKIIKTLKKSYRTQRIHLGMDESYFMGYGRYHWFINENNYDTQSLFVEHLNKVVAIAQKYGFTKPEIWSDNLFEMAFKGYIDPPDAIYKPFPEKITEKFPAVKLVYWNYSIRDEKAFAKNCRRIRQLSDNIGFASMAHGYASFAPENYKTAKLVKTALNGCLQNGISDLLITRWETVQSPFSMLPSYYDYIERCSKAEGYDFEKRSKFLFGYTYTEFLTLDEPNKIDFGKSEDITDEVNPPFYILADDPLLGIMEKHIPSTAKEYYTECAAKLGGLSKRKSRFAHIFKFEKVLCEAVAAKASLSKDVKTCYDNKDKSGMAKIAEEIPRIIRKLELFHNAYRDYWTSYNKRFGFELFDARIGGAVARLKFVRALLSDYADGKTETIEELEEERLPLYAGGENKIVCYKNWTGIAVGRLTRL